MMGFGKKNQAAREQTQGAGDVAPDALHGDLPPAQGDSAGVASAPSEKAPAGAVEPPEPAVELQVEGLHASAAPEPTPPPPAGPSVDEVKAQLAASEDKYLRMLAEFDNYKRRTSREYKQMVDSANAGIMKDLIEVRDNFERAIAASSASAGAQSVEQGMKLIFTKFDEILAKHGLEPFACEADEFDPVVHDALMRMPHATIAEDHVAQVLERGYRLKGQVIKHARVIVSAGAPAPIPATAEADSTTDTK